MQAAKRRTEPPNMVKFALEEKAFVSAEACRQLRLAVTALKKGHQAEAREIITQLIEG